MIGSNAQADFFDPLCRKIAVAKQVWDEYEPSWKKPANAQVLPDADWSLLIAVLLASSSSETSTSNESQRAVALKNLNAALQAIDIAANRPNVPHLDALNRWASELIHGKLDDIS